MGDLSDNFSRWEFACGCKCGADTVDAKLLDMVQDLRNVFGPISISSGHRCPAHNKKVGGGEHSQHLLGRAADLHFKGVPLPNVVNFINNHYQNTGMGIYDDFIHLDSRNHKARWQR